MDYILDQNRIPLIPTNRHGKIKHLLKDGKAKIVNREKGGVVEFFSND